MHFSFVEYYTIDFSLFYLFSFHCICTVPLRSPCPKAIVHLFQPKIAAFPCFHMFILEVQSGYSHLVNISLNFIPLFLRFLITSKAFGAIVWLWVLLGSARITCHMIWLLMAHMGSYASLWSFITFFVAACLSCTSCNGKAAVAPAQTKQNCSLWLTAANHVYVSAATVAITICGASVERPTTFVI